MNRFQWERDVRRGAGLTHGDKTVATALSAYAGEDGTRAYPSVATLADDTDMQERGVRKSLAKLIRLGYLSPDRRGGKSTNYTLTKRARVDLAKGCPVGQGAASAPVPQDRNPCPTGPQPLSEGTPKYPLITKNNQRAVSAPPKADTRWRHLVNNGMAFEEYMDSLDLSPHQKSVAADCVYYTSDSGKDPEWIITGAIARAREVGQPMTPVLAVPPHEHDPSAELSAVAQ